MPIELDDRGLTIFLAGLDEALGEASAETVKLVADLARQLAPVDEGDFRDSIEPVAGDSQMSARVISDGGKAPHNIFVEFGDPSNTAYPAQPTLGPAAEAIDPGLEAAKKLRDLAARSAI